MATVQRINDLFQRKGWIAEPLYELNNERLFDVFCRMMDAIPDSAHDLLFDLAEDYLWCRYPEYPAMLHESLRNIPLKRVQASQHIYFLPLLTPEDIAKGKNKSGIQLLYFAEHCSIKGLDVFHGKRQCTDFLTSSDHICKIPSRTSGERSLIIFVDDFVGSGDTACDALLDFKTRHQQENDDIIVVALVALRAGIDSLEKQGYSIYCHEIRYKGISDSNRIIDKSAALLVMDDLGRLLNVQSTFYRGYRGSEALVSMLRTPNNTFPVFWCKSRNNGAPWPCPFPR